MSTAEACRLLPSGGPWSARYLIAEGRRQYVDETLSRAGVTVDDIPELRKAAVARSE